MADTEDRAKIVVEMQDRASGAMTGMSASWGKFIGGISLGNVIADQAAKILAKVKDAISSMTVDAAQVAARIEVLNHVFEMTGQRAGYSSEQLETTKNKLMALGIAEQEAVGIGMRFIQAQLDIADATKIARAAQDLAVISGENSSETAAQLTDAIVKQQPILLKQYGIIADLNDIYGAQAKALNKSVDGLTASEKRQAFLNEILRQAKTVAGSYETAMEDVGKRLTSLPRYLQQAQNAIGQHFLPIMELAVDGATEFLKAIEAAFTPDTDQLVKSINIMDESRTKFDSTTTTIIALRKEYDELAKVVEPTATQHDRMRTILNQLEKAFPGVVLGLEAETGAMRTNLEVLDDLVAKRDEQRRNQEQDKLAEVADQYVKLAEDIRIWSRMQDEARTGLFNLQQGMDLQGRSVQNLSEYMDRQSDVIAGWKATVVNAPEFLGRWTEEQDRLLLALSEMYPNLAQNQAAQALMNDTLIQAVIAFQATHKSIAQQNEELDKRKGLVEANISLDQRWSEATTAFFAAQDQQWKSINENLGSLPEDYDLIIASNQAMAEVAVTSAAEIDVAFEKSADSQLEGMRKILDAHHASVVKRREDEQRMQTEIGNIATRGMHDMVSKMVTGRGDFQDIFKGMAQDFMIFFIEEALKSLILSFIPGIGGILGGIFDTPANDRMAMTQGKHFAQYFTRGALDTMSEFGPQFASATAGPAGGSGGGGGGNTFIFQGPITDRRFVSDTVVPLVEGDAIHGMSSITIDRSNLTGSDNAIFL